MSTNFHTPVAPGAADVAATFNSPMGQLDSAISSALTGGQAVTQLNFGLGATLNSAAGGSIAITHTIHPYNITDNNHFLNAITGGADGDILILETSDTLLGSYPQRVEIRNNSGADGIQIVGQKASTVSVYSTDGMARLLFVRRGGLWYFFPTMPSTGVGIPQQSINYQAYPDYPLDDAATSLVRTVSSVISSAATLVAVGATITTGGTLQIGIQARFGQFTNTFTAALATEIGVKATQQCGTLAQSPKLDGLIYFPSDLTNRRNWFGFDNSVSSFNGTTPTTYFLGLRFHSGDGDTTWKLIATDGTTLYSKNFSQTVTADTKYYLSVRVVPKHNSLTGVLVIARIGHSDNSNIEWEELALEHPTLVISSPVIWHCNSYLTVAASRTISIARVVMATS